MRTKNIDFSLQTSIIDIKATFSEADVEIVLWFIVPTLLFFLCAATFLYFFVFVFIRFYNSHLEAAVILCRGAFNKKRTWMLHRLHHLTPFIEPLLPV